MKPNYKFVRVVLGAVVGSVLWAGCASERCDPCNRATTTGVTVNEPAGAQYVRARPAALDWQENLSRFRADTHPEWRTGWNMAFPNPPYANPTVDDLNIAFDQPSLTPPESR
jgi:hypothetical protein